MHMTSRQTLAILLLAAAVESQVDRLPDEYEEETTIQPAEVNNDYQEIPDDPEELELRDEQYDQHTNTAGRRSAGFEAQVAPFPCTDSTAPLQVIGSGGKYDVKILNVTAGQYTDFWELPLNLPTSGFETLNAVGINTEDSTAYGMVKSNSLPYLARFGEDANDQSQMRLEYVARVPAWSYSGTTDKQGNFHILDQQGSTKKLYTFTDVHQLVGYTDTTAPGLADLTDNLVAFQYSGPNVADIVPLKAVLEAGTDGSPRDYLVGADRNKVVVIRVADVGYGYSRWTLTATSTLGIDLNALGTYGAAWNYPDTDGNDHIYITSNEGAGVFEVVDMDLDAGTARIVPRSQASERTSNNDGMNCLEASAFTFPPTLSPTKAPTDAPTKSPTKAPTEPPTEAPTIRPGCKLSYRLVGDSCKRCGRNRQPPCLEEETEVCDIGHVIHNGECRTCGHGGLFCPSEEPCQQCIGGRKPTWKRLSSQDCNGLGERSCAPTDWIPEDPGVPACTVLAHTRHTTCSDFCEQSGMVCVRGQDNVGGNDQCTLDPRHERKSTTNNGCDQSWNNQVCQCAKPVCGACGKHGQPACKSTGCAQGTTLAGSVCRACGKNNWIPCEGNVCDAGWGLYGGRCKCGHRGQVPCTAGCHGGHTAVGGLCHRCGRHNQPPCTRELDCECDPGHRLEGGLCRLCGAENRLPCLNDDGAEQCDVGLVVEDGRCKECGGSQRGDQRACKRTDGTPFCMEGKEVQLCKGQPICTDPTSVCPGSSVPQLLNLNTVCSVGQLQTAQECESAAEALGFPYRKSQGGQIHWTGNTAGIPCGCSVRVVPQGCTLGTAGCYHGLHWNERTSGCNPRNDQRPICCSGN